MLDKALIIDTYDLTFDPGDKRNGSLYLGTPRGKTSTLDVPATLDALRAAGLWSDVEPKTVPDEHRQAYKDQLNLLQVLHYGGDTGYLIARFDHPKFPSDAARWEAWRAFFARLNG